MFIPVPAVKLMMLAYRVTIFSMKLPVRCTYLHFFSDDLFMERLVSHADNSSAYITDNEDKLNNGNVDFC